MKKMVLFMGAVFALSTIQAQNLSWGIHAGGGISNIHSGNSRVYNIKNKSACFVGGEMDYFFSEHGVLQWGVDLIFSGTSYSVGDDYISNSANGLNRIEYAHLEKRELSTVIPVSIGYRYRIGSRSHLIPSIGCYFNYALTDRHPDVTLNKDIPNSSEIRIQDYNRYDYGLQAALKGVIDKHYTVSIGYTYGLKSVSKDYGWKRQNLLLGLGYLF